MTGLERNADVVTMTSYAPLLAHADGWQWTPDLIWFNNLSSYATPNYYVQKLFSNNKGTDLLKITEKGKALTGQNKLYSSAVFDEKTKEIIIKIVNADSQPKEVNFNAKNLRLDDKMIKIILSADTLDTENSFTSEPFSQKRNLKA
jgi:alpha-N-arabinofuranosidase